MHNLSSHGYNRLAPLPAAADLLRWVDGCDQAALHWEWDVSSPERFFNRHGEAVFAAKTVEYLPRGLFIVARLFLDAFRGPFPPRSSFRSGCGFLGCVNPHHWEYVLRPLTVRLEPADGGWRPVQIRTGKPFARNVPLIVHAGDATTHVIVAVPGAAQSYRTLCGLEVYPTNLVVHPTNALVTCKGGCT